MTVTMPLFRRPKWSRAPSDADPLSAEVPPPEFESKSHDGDCAPFRRPSAASSNDCAVRAHLSKHTPCLAIEPSLEDGAECQSDE